MVAVIFEIFGIKNSLLISQLANAEFQLKTNKSMKILKNAK